MPWSLSVTKSRVLDAVNHPTVITIKSLTREIDLATKDIPLDEAYRVDGVHGYVEIVNARSLLDSDATESERSHKRFLRFLHLFQRVVHVGILADTDVYKVDHQNQRVHLIVYKPYDNLARRVAVMVTVGAVLRDLASKASELHDELGEDVRVKVGVETGECLAVRNGTRGDRELLFLGHAANHAAKLLGGSADGVYLGASARAAMGTDFATADDKKIPLTASQIEACRTQSGVSLSAESLLSRWKEALAQTPLADFSFSRPKPPLSDLSFAELTPANSRRIEAAAIMADVDGFSAYVAGHMGNDLTAGEAVRVLHVIRKELRDVLNDFGGKKVRYLGDCVQGALALGATETDRAKTTEEALWCAAAMRDAFAVCLSHFPAASKLGLAIGLELGPLSITRLGVKGSRDRCVAGHAMLTAEERQRQCNGTQTAVGAKMVDAATGRVKKLLERGRVIDALTTNRLDALLREEETKVSRTVTDAGGAAITLPKAYRR